MKNYLIGFFVTVFLHILMLLLIPSGTYLIDVVVDDNTPLIEMEFYDEPASEESLEEQAQEVEEPPQEKPEEEPVEPDESVEPEEPEEPIEEPIEEIPDDVIAEEEVERPIEKPVQVVQSKPKVSSTPQVVVKSSSATSSTVVSSSELDAKNFKPFGNKKPKYPSIARKANIEGWVMVKVLVNAKGKAEKVKVLEYQGHPAFKKATINVAYLWRFPIPTRRGKRVRTWYKKKVSFRLRD